MKCEDAVIRFGKHRGQSLGDILANDPSYLDWLLAADIRDQRFRLAVEEINAKYADRIEQAIEFKRSERF